jgi:hypothetical protein
MNWGPVALSAAALLAGAGGCAGFPPAGPSNQPAPPAVADASRVDMCTILTGDELAKLGLHVPSRQRVNTAGVVGCRWPGKPYLLSLERAEGSLAGYRAHRNDPTYVGFTDNTVNGRAGAHFGVDRSGAQCAQLMDGGPVVLSVSVAVPPNQNPRVVDPCAEALRIAQMIEPRLPKVVPSTG